MRLKELKRKIREEPFPLEEAFWTCLGLGFGIYITYVGRVTTEIVAGLVITILLVVFLAFWSCSVVELRNFRQK